MSGNDDRDAMPQTSNGKSQSVGVKTKRQKRESLKVEFQQLYEEGKRTLGVVMAILTGKYGYISR